MVDKNLQQKTDTLLEILENSGPLVVAFSGGVDSSLLAVAAQKSGNQSVLAATSDSASLATGEREICESFCRIWQIDWTVVRSQELTNEKYAVNNPDRCYWCKSALMDKLEPLAEKRGAKIALGVNKDDLGDHRPGQEAAAERGAIFPLVEANFDKSDIRALAKEWDIVAWDRPAMPCLSSRIPYGTEVTVPLLSKIDRAESALRDLGFTDIRVRHYDKTARIEVPRSELADAAVIADQIVDRLKMIGYEYVTLDLAGLLSGNLNAVHLEKVASLDG